ncbi:MAG: DUF5615 family PIN-like protein [Bacteroidota bacterium]
MIKLLLDANLSYRLVKKLHKIYPESIHVTRTGLPIPAQDIAIWEWAKKNNYLIVTNDEDFEHLLNLYHFPPKVILLRTGNQLTNSIAKILFEYFDEIVSFEKSEELGLLEIV